MKSHKLLITISICAICLCLLAICFTAVSNTTPTIAKALLFQKVTFYTDAQLPEIADLDGTADELFPLYPPSHIRRIKNDVNKDNTTDVFGVFYLGETKALKLIIDNLGNRIWQCSYNTIESKKTFDSLSLGQTLTDVKNLDPNGNYLYLPTGLDLPTGRIYPATVSEHYTRDGFVIFIIYDENDIIISIDIERM